MNKKANCHSKYHSANAFCCNAGPEEMAHLRELISKLTDEEIKLLVEKVGIQFLADEKDVSRDDYETVIDEADRDVFYREYRKIIEAR